MKNLNILKILLLLVIALGLSSCGDEYYTDDYLRNSDVKLCGKTWVEEYTVDNGDLCKHHMKYARDNSGREFFEYYRKDENRPYKENSYTFDWKWIDSSMEGLEINYGGGDVLFFDNVWVREHNLSGKLDGVIVMFVDEDYY